MLRWWALVVALSSACASGRALEHVRASPANDGMSLYVAASAEQIVQVLPELLQSLHYREVETHPRGVATEVLAKRRFSFRHGGALAVRLIVEPDALVRTTLKLS